jgi:lysozyme family protein
MADFFLAIDYVLENEGGYCNNPKDPGGATNFGILQRDWPQVDIATVTRSQAISWYQPNYWNKAPYVGIASQQVATKLFDMHVNLGLASAMTIAQQALGFSGSDVDGCMGPHTLAGINAAAGANFLADVANLLTLHYKELEQRNPSLAAFDRGWTARATKLPPVDPAGTAAA